MHYQILGFYFHFWLYWEQHHPYWVYRLASLFLISIRATLFYVRNKTILGGVVSMFFASRIGKNLFDFETINLHKMIYLAKVLQWKSTSYCGLVRLLDGSPWHNLLVVNWPNYLINPLVLLLRISHFLNLTFKFMNGPWNMWISNNECKKYWA
jgi:hypothetical protein